MTLLYMIFRTGGWLIRILEYAMLAYCIMSWFQPRFQAFYTLRQLLQPFVAPFQALSMKVMRYFNAPLDLTFFFAILGYEVLERLWWALYRALALRMF